MTDGQRWKGGLFSTNFLSSWASLVTGKCQERRSPPSSPELEEQASPRPAKPPFPPMRGFRGSSRCETQSSTTGHEEHARWLGTGPAGPSNAKPAAQLLEHPRRAAPALRPDSPSLCKGKLLPSAEQAN